jgi:hypothetical protein
MKPPIYKKTYLCPKEAVVSESPNPLVKGNKIIGNKAVTAIGIASVIHHIAIQAVDARIALALGFSPSGLKKNKIKMNANGPEIKPIFL